jgi:hypothetical protein
MYHEYFCGVMMIVTLEEDKCHLSKRLYTNFPRNNALNPAFSPLYVACKYSSFVTNITFADDI